MVVPEDIRDIIMDLKSQMYSKGSIVREVKRLTKDKALAREYVDEVLIDRKKQLTASPSIYKGEGKNLIVTGVIFILIPLAMIAIFPDFVAIRGAIIVAPILIVLGILKYFGVMK